MAAPVAKFIVTGDFSHEPVQIATDSFSLISLQRYVNNNEYKYLRRMIGDDLYTQLIADLSPTPPTVPLHPKFLALLNGATYTNAAGKVIIYEGFKDALKHFIWLEYVRRSDYKNTISGTTKGQNENSANTVASEISALCRKAYGDGVNFARGVYYFIMNFEDYTAEASAIILTSGTTYTVSIPDTKYLKNGDTVTIRSTNFVIGNLIDNISFTVDSGTDISGTEVKVDWDIFGTFSEPIMEVSFLNR